jgi:hypothetical protein
VIVNFGQFFLITKWAKLLGYFSYEKLCTYQFLPKNGLGYILGDFSKNHLVTLITRWWSRYLICGNEINFESKCQMLPFKMFNPGKKILNRLNTVYINSELLRDFRLIWQRHIHMYICITETAINP